MENNTSILEPLIERAEEYGKTSLELIKLKTVDKTTDVLSTLISRGIFFIVFFIFLVTVNIGASIWLGTKLGRLYYGFFCVGAFYGLLAIALYFFLHEQIKKNIGNSMISQMLN